MTPSLITYWVEKPSSQWRIMRFADGRSVGTIIGTYRSKKDAVRAARLLAGWSGSIVVATSKGTK